MAQDLLSRDLAILEEMISYLGDYLLTEDTHWVMHRAAMPKMTIGGCLMRLHRLQLLQAQCSAEEQQRLQQAQAQFEGEVTQSVVRFENRVHQELRVRLKEWVHYLSDLSHHMVGDRNYFADKVDTRVVVAAMMKKMQQSPYRLQAQVVAELQPLDRNLRSRWQPGPFVWDEVWQPAYNEDEYWYLYGVPR